MIDSLYCRSSQNPSCLTSAGTRRRTSNVPKKQSPKTARRETTNLQQMQKYCATAHWGHLPTNSIVNCTVGQDKFGASVFNELTVRLCVWWDCGMVGQADSPILRISTHLKPHWVLFSIPYCTKISYNLPIISHHMQLCIPKSLESQNTERHVTIIIWRVQKTSELQKLWHVSISLSHPIPLN